MLSHTLKYPSTTPKTKHRCYACKSVFGGAVRQSPLSPGLCDPCHLRTTECKRELANLSRRKFDQTYFERGGVDPPAWKGSSRCTCCGVIGSSFGWNEWYERSDPSKPGGWAVEGDGYVYCTNCRVLLIDPWSAESRRKLGPVAAKLRLIRLPATAGLALEMAILLTIIMAIVVIVL